MKMGIIGLGRMGGAVAFRVVQAGHEVIGYDSNKKARKNAQEDGIEIANSIADIAEKTRIIWLMVPAGDIVDNIIKDLLPQLKAGDIIIDGGNSHYKNSIRRAEFVGQKGVIFLDCGTSGGVYGRAYGFCLMVGGDNVAYTKVHQLLAAIAAPGGLAHIGPIGSGHYVKMVHNGIEYALLQAYAEGFHLIKEGHFKDAALNLEEIARIWNESAVIRSFILELAHNVFREDQELHAISGEIAESGTGLWTIEEAQEQKIPAEVIEQSLHVRKWSRETGGNYATKIVALLRQQFGGHAVKKIKGD